MEQAFSRRAAIGGGFALGGLLILPGKARAAGLLDGLGLTKLLGNASDSALALAPAARAQHLAQEIGDVGRALHAGGWLPSTASTGIGHGCWRWR